MVRPDAPALELVLAAASDPIVVLRIAQSRLIEARDLATINFDEYQAAAQVREVSVILAAVADSLKEHSLSPPFPRPSRSAVKAAVKAYEQDASVAPAEPAGESPAWAAL